MTEKYYNKYKIKLTCPGCRLVFYKSPIDSYGHYWDIDDTFECPECGREVSADD